jgi:hypothetical protein
LRDLLALLFHIFAVIGSGPPPGPAVIQLTLHGLLLCPENFQLLFDF